jgi:hypothetical protein
VQRFVGLDFQEDGAELIDGARRLIGGLVPSVEIVDVDTQLAFPALAEQFALVHVDADHSTRGALSDLANALPLVEPGGVIVVDDYDTPPVAAGVHALLAALAPAPRHLAIANYRGHMLIWPGAGRPDLAAVFARMPRWAVRLIEIEDLVLAARQSNAEGPFALRARAALAARVLGLLGDSPALLPTGARPALEALLAQSRALARALGHRLEQGPQAGSCREAMAEIEGHVRYCEERRGRDDAVDCALLGEFALHAANFALRVAAPALMPPE